MFFYAHERLKMAISASAKLIGCFTFDKSFKNILKGQHVFKPVDIGSIRCAKCGQKGRRKIYFSSQFQAALGHRWLLRIGPRCGNALQCGRCVNFARRWGMIVAKCQLLLLARGRRCILGNSVNGHAGNSVCHISIHKQRARF